MKDFSIHKIVSNHIWLRKKVTIRNKNLQKQHKRPFN